MFLAFAISVTVTILALIPLIFLVATSGERAARLVVTEKAAFRAWDREQMKRLGLHFAVTERTAADGGVQRLCGLSVQASEKTAVIYDGRALVFVPLDASLMRHSSFALATEFDYAKTIAACECQLEVPDRPYCP